VADGTGLAGRIDGYLKKYGSPMTGLGSTYVAAGRKYGVDPRLPVAISIAESSGGKHILGSFNAWGWGPGIPFASWQEGISTVTRGIKTGYYSEGRRTPAQISTKWAPASDGNNPSHWSETVGQIMRELGASPVSSAALAVASPASAATLTVPKTATAQLPVAQLQAVLGQVADLSTPSTAGVRGAIFQNLGEIAQYGHSTGSGLGNLLVGTTQDRQTDEINRQRMLDLLDAMPSITASATPATTPTTAAATTDTTTSKPSPASLYNTAVGQPIPKSLLTSIGGEHPTANLPGYPAHDYFAPSGSVAVSPIAGTVIRLSGRSPADPPTSQHGAFGLSLYIKGDDGRTYYMTHMGSRDVGKGSHVELGQPVGTVGDFARYGTPSHIHLGISG